MDRICRNCKSSIPNYTRNHRWCEANQHIVEDTYTCPGFHYIECCESCHFFHDGCVKGHETMYLDRCMCRDEYEERIDL